jgi:hypothetical protein
MSMPCSMAAIHEIFFYYSNVKALPAVVIVA